MLKGGAVLEKKRLAITACWIEGSSASVPTTGMGSWGCASGEPMVKEGRG